jgi:DNA-binding NarL/FixJ family response regulator
MRTAYKRVLESQSNLQIVAMATNEEEAVQKAKQTAPDVAILDVRMPILDGIQAAHEIRIQRPETAIVVISASDDLALVADLMRNGVERKSYLLKQSIYDVLGLARTIEAVYEGHTILDSGIIQRMAHLFCKHADNLDTGLNDTEQDLLCLMAEECDDGQLSETLRLGSQQVMECSGSRYRKFGLNQGTDCELRMMAIRRFVSQIHKVPLTDAYRAVS